MVADSGFCHVRILRTRRGNVPRNSCASCYPSFRVPQSVTLGVISLPQVYKTLEYRRARFNVAGQDLEALLRQAWARFPTQIARAVTRRDGVATTALKSRDFGAAGFALQCARFVDGQGVGTIPMSPVASADLGERPPVAGENYLNTGFFGLVRSNHVVCLDCGRNGGALRNYLAELFRQAGFPAAAQQFELIRVGSPDKLAIIQRVGVKKIDLSVGIASATAEEVLEPDAGGGFLRRARGYIGEAIRGITALDQDLEQLRESEQGMVTVSINVKEGDLAAAKDGLDHLASEIVEDEDAEAFVIHLRDGNTIRPDQVAVSKRLRIEAHANSVSPVQAWNAMNDYMMELERVGQFEA